MLLSLGIATAYVLLASFLLVPKRLHPLEQLFGAFLSVFIYAIHFLALSINRQWYEVNTAADSTFVFLLVRFVMTPVLMLWMLELMGRLRSLLAKILLVAAYAGCCIAGTVVLRSAGILIYHQWHPFAIYRFWIVQAIITAASVRWYRTVLKKEVKLS